MELHRLDGEEVIGSISASLSNSLETDWHVPPIIGRLARWTVLDAAQAGKLLVDLAEALSAGQDWINCEPVTRVRTLPILFYPDATLCEAEVKLFDGSNGLITFLKTSDSCVLLNGTSTPIHKLNASGKIDLSEPENVIQYLQFFCAAVQADAGPFTVVSAQEELELTRNLKTEEAYELSERLYPPTMPVIDTKEKKWRLAASVLYASLVFQAKFEIQENGIVTMTDQDWRSERELPVKIWAFWGNVRQRMT